MKQSRRSSRMRRHHRRSTQAAALNLVSLMDIFTILVFFLLVNSSNVEVLPNTKVIKLPASVAEQKPRETLVVMLTDADIYLQGKHVMSLADAQASELRLQPLVDALRVQNSRYFSRDASQHKFAEVTVMGSQKAPYYLLKKIIYSCGQASFTRVSLAVVQKSFNSDKAP